MGSKSWDKKPGGKPKKKENGTSPRERTMKKAVWPHKMKKPEGGMLNTNDEAGKL
jgi:hypothetical protein